MVLLPHVLLHLALGQVLATVLLFLLAAFLWQLVSPLLLLELGVSRLALDCTDFVCLVALLLFPGRMLLPGHKGHSLNVSKIGKWIGLLSLSFALVRKVHLLGRHTHIEYLSENIHVLW